MGGWLLTGGAGYIGSHVAREMAAAGMRVVVLDDLSSGVMERVSDDVPFVRADIGDGATVRRVLREHRVEGVIHLAARKAVEESCADPLLYYRQNVAGLMSMLDAMQAEGVGRLVFSSSAAVYGTQDDAHVDESAPTAPDSPYGRTKLVGEWMVRDAVAAHGVAAVNLRYFNVVGCADPALADLAGENLFPALIARVAAGRPVSVYGSDYPTPDGTCVRDYIHVQDLAEAHVAATRLTAGPGSTTTVNVGCGRGHSVLDVVREFGRAAGRPVPYALEPRRDGDPAAMVADASRAADVLGWTARLGLAEMVDSAWAAAVAAGLVALPPAPVTDDVDPTRADASRPRIRLAEAS
jgi:UDP-glucose 4-epimerase